MKQLTIILFITIYLLNLAGNSLYLDYLMEKSSDNQNHRIDYGAVDRSSLLEIKIPFTAPYYSSSPGFERYYGEVNIDGSYYTYVERKVSNDTIYMLCLPDHHKTKLQKAKSELTASELGVADKSNDKPPKPISKKIAAEYDEFSQPSFALKAFNPDQSFLFSYTTQLTCGTNRDLIKPPGSQTFA